MTTLLNINISGFLTTIVGIVIAFLFLLFLITIHELGHYTMCKLLGFKINEFAIGFGKEIYSKTNKSGEKVSLRVLPLGGYCAFDGEDQNSDSSTAFNNQKPWKRIIVLLGGVAFNFISAIIFSIILIAVIGNGTVEVVDVVGINSSQLQQGDVILEVNNEKVKFINGGVGGLTAGYTEGETIVLTIERNGQVIEGVEVERFMYEPEDDTQQPYLTMGLSLQYVDYSFGQALVQCVPFSFEMAWDFMVILCRLFTGQMSLQNVGGPVTAIGSIGKSATTNMLSLLLLLPVISINLAVFNVLPIPALDGARIVFVVIEWIRQKPIHRELEFKIHMVGLIVLFSLVILIDILHLVLF